MEPYIKNLKSRENGRKDMLLLIKKAYSHLSNRKMRDTLSVYKVKVLNTCGRGLMCSKLIKRIFFYLTIQINTKIVQK